MLTKPFAGWCTMSVGSFSERASYLTDVPNECLIAFARAISEGVPACIEFDAEGWNYILVSTSYQSYVLNFDDEFDSSNIEVPHVIVVEKSIYDLSEELIGDISRDLNEWLYWNTDTDEDNPDENIEANLLRLKSALYKHKQRRFETCDQSTD